MAGSVSSSSARNLGVGRFYSPPHLRRQLELLQQQEKMQKLSEKKKQKSESDARVDSDDSCSTPPAPPLSNLDRFLQSTTPVVNAIFPAKINARSRRNGETSDSQPYFFLGDLWESFKEWSAYGAGVPVSLNGTDGVIQYYVPYLSGIQLYAESPRIRSRSRQSSDEFGADSSRETSIVSSSLEAAANHITERISRVSMADKPLSAPESSSGDGGDFRNSPGALIFEYLERDPPYGREPLADKVSVLASRFPELKNFRSSDLLPSSWMSVAWYPIYRIPTGPTLRDLDACFLTFHCLSTPSKDTEVGQGKGGKTMTLPTFGLASYKLKGLTWESSGAQDQQVGALLQAAEAWLRRLQVDHPDFSFFSHNGHGPASRR